MRHRLEGISLLGVFIGIGLLLLVAALVVPRFMLARTRGSLTACKSNLKNIGTALEMYSTDHEGRFPEALTQLTPDYLKSLPSCPSNGSKDSYREGYRHREGIYRVACARGDHERIYEPGFPAYNSIQGLIEKAGDPVDEATDLLTRGEEEAALTLLRENLEALGYAEGPISLVFLRHGDRETADRLSSSALDRTLERPSVYSLPEAVNARARFLRETGQEGRLPELYRQAAQALLAKDGSTSGRRLVESWAGELEKLGDAQGAAEIRAALEPAPTPP